jgi:hypothetical protein
MKSDKQIVGLLEAEWDLSSGFFGRLRQGHYDAAAYQRVKLILEEIDFSGSLAIDRRLVSLLWYLPLFMSWQHERVAEKRGDVASLRSATDAVESELERILGVP